MATGTIKSLIRIGSFRIQLTGTSVTEVTNQNIIEGSLPPSASMSLFKVTNASNSAIFTTNIYTEGPHIYMNTNVPQTYVVRWFQFF